MSYRSNNYTAFYVAEPFNECNLGAHATPDFIHYNRLKACKAQDSSFPFINAHDTTYNVRDNSNWEYTLKPRLRARLRNSKNIILILSENTKESRALREEIKYGIGELGLPVIVVYPDLSNSQIGNGNSPGYMAKKYWDKLPSLKKLIESVPSVHVPLSKDKITQALNDNDFTIQHKISNYCWRYHD